MRIKNFRHDIAGLRAVAILLVLLFHYGVTSMSGGFVGVDVFFVISGYVITKSIADDVGRNGHSVGPLLARFYNRRIRRIVPALVAVLAATLIAGWFLLMPGDYTSTGESAAYSAIGAGNLYFYWHTGYFDREAELQPLLNMWSLGVEEQFYLVWPLLLGAILWVSKGRRAVVAGIVAALVLVGLICSVQTAASDPTAAFYLPYPRAWELGVGALLAFLPSVRWRAVSELMGVVGLALIGWSVFTLVGTTASPGWPMVPAVLGSALLVWPRAENWTARILGLRPFTFIGDISYSLYLIHWPLLVLFRHYANGDTPTWLEATVLGVVSVGLSYLSWRFVEEPVRNSTFQPWPTITGGLGASAIVAIAGLAVVQAGGFVNRISPEIKKLSSLDVMWEWACPVKTKFDELAMPYCIFGAPWESASTKGMLWGDSHAEHMAPIVEAAAKGTSSSFILYRACPAPLGEHVRRVWKEVPDYVANCISWRTAAIKFLHDRPDVNLVIFSAAWTSLVNLVSQDGTLPGDPDPYSLIVHGVETLIDEAAMPGRRFIVIADVPQLIVDPVPCATKNLLGLLRQDCAKADGTVSSAQFHDRQGKIYAELSKIAAGRDDVRMVVPGEHLCTGEWCQTYLGGEFLYRDASHIRRNLSDQTKRDYADLIGLTAVLRDLNAPVASLK
jgi:peptidoglycan/LPS O-acetylase OafA/YrhL